MRIITINFQKFGTWKVQLTTAINFISSIDADEERVMYLNSNNTEFMIYDHVNYIVDELFESLFLRYQIGLETSMRESNFIFDSIQLLYYKCPKINLNTAVHKLIPPD